MTTDADYLSVLGKYWGEQELRDFVSSLGISDAPKIKRGETTGYLRGKALGIDLTFRKEDSLDVPLREYPEGAVVLNNVRFYAKKTGPLQPFTGTLPLGLRFGTSKQSLLQDLGPPDFEVPDRGILRWDRDRYALFLVLEDDGTLGSVALQLPVVKAGGQGA